MTKIHDRVWLTKYVVGAKANPPKNPRSPPKKGKVMPTNMVNAAIEKCHTKLSSNQAHKLVFDPTTLFDMSIRGRGVYLPTYTLRVMKRRVLVGRKCNFFTNTVSIMSNTGIA